jgi:hypothetical protein
MFFSVPLRFSVVIRIFREQHHIAGNGGLIRPGSSHAYQEKSNVFSLHVPPRLFSEHTLRNNRPVVPEGGIGLASSCR